MHTRGLSSQRGSQLSHEKSERMLDSTHNEWTPRIHFKGTSFSHYIAINLTGSDLYLVPILAQRYVPASLPFLPSSPSWHIHPLRQISPSENENASPPNQGYQKAGGRGGGTFASTAEVKESSDDLGTTVESKFVDRLPHGSQNNVTRTNNLFFFGKSVGLKLRPI